MQTFSFLQLLRRSFGGHLSWAPHWRKAAPKAAYDIVIVGGSAQRRDEIIFEFLVDRIHPLGPVQCQEQHPVGGEFLQ